MALILVLAKSPQIIDWKSLLFKIESMNIKEVEVFPIPRELGFENDALGLAVTSNFESKENVLLEISKLITLLISMSFELTELYNGELIDEQNLREILLPLLP
jgi:hypothetical protein